MKKLINISMLLGVAMLVSSFYSPPADSIQFTILPESQVTIKGSSNVNSFTCYNSEVNGKIEIMYDVQTATVVNSNANILMRVVGFNCGNDLMENDMQEALKATSNPQIEFSATDGEIIDTLFSSNAGQYYKIKIAGQITLAGTTKATSVTFTGRRAGNLYYLQGTKTLKMTDFGVKPPTAMFGMIKTRETIHLNFDLRLRKN